MFDLVYTVKDGNNNEQLKWSLRSVNKFAPEYGNVWVVGGRPDFLSNEIKSIRTTQTKTSIENVGKNIIAVCKNEGVAENFILMNDDFVLTRKIDEWDLRSLSKGRLQDQYDMYYKTQPMYANAINNTIELLGMIFPGMRTFENYGLHLPFVINKKRYMEIIESPFIDNYIHDKKQIMWRSLYGNMNCIDAEHVNDVKLYEDGIPNTEWISLPHDYSGFKTLNEWLKNNMPEKCKYEK